jgi:tetratricopeptide (TPR) repeat protein
MPSLQALQEFKSSFARLGGEAASLREQRLPFSDLELPTQEAEARVTKAAAQEAAGMAALANMGLDPEVASSLGLESGPEAEQETPEADDLGFGGDLDLSALLGSVPGDISEPESPADLPDGLPDGLADDIETTPPDTDFPGFDEAGGIDLDDAMDEAGAAPDSAADDESFDLDNLDDFSFGDEDTPPDSSASDESFNLDDLGSFDLGGEDLENLAEETAGDTPDITGDPGDTPEDAIGDEAFDIPGLDDFSMPDLEESGGEPPAETTDTAPNGVEDSEAFNLDDLGDLGSFDLGGEDLENPVEGIDGVPNGGDEAFDIPDMDDFATSSPDENGETVGGIGGIEGIGEDFRAEAGPEDESTPESEATDSGLDDPAFGAGFTEEDLAVPSGSADGFDKFSIGDTPGDTPELGAEGGGSGEGPAGESATGEGGDAENAGIEDFTLQGFDDVFDSISPKKAAAGPAPGRGKKAAVEEEPEEIQLNEKDLASLHSTLNSYPLNLRIACEEIISEMVVPEAQLFSLVRLLVRGAPPKETAALAGKILGRNIPIPRGFEKKTGEELEAEQASFAYIFVHNFLPVLRLCMFVLLAAGCLFYLAYRFVYTPLRAESFYKLGYERIEAGEYEQANERFNQAFGIHRVKNWFYRYAEAFRDERQYNYAERKYDDLLRFYPRDKKGVLDYAALETYYLRNYEKADSLLRRNILDYQVNDPDALLALGDNALAWGEEDASQYEEARFAYARYMEYYGQKDPVMERMLKYFMRTDNLKEVLPLQVWFMGDLKRKISAETLAELGGYLIDKRTEEVRGVPNEYVEQIQEVRDVLLRAVQAGPELPEAHYHLSRYYRNLSNIRDEQLTLEVALRTFDTAREESIRRLTYHIEALKRHAEILTNRREFKPAEADLVKAIGLYQDGLDRMLLSPNPGFGQLFAAMGDLEYFTKQGDMEMTLNYYRRAEQAGWTPPDMLYRMGSAHYHLREWAPALERFFTASSQLPLNRKILLALGNACYMRNDYFAAEGYYGRLLDMLEAERSRLPVLLPNDRPEYIELAERLMIARNNMGVVLESLTETTGNSRYRAQALGYYTESARAWDTLTRNPETMIRLGAGELSSPGISRPYLNAQNLLYPRSGYEAVIFPEIDKDVLEPSLWEEIAPQ